MAAKAKRVRLKLLKHVLIDGKHTEKGSTIEMDRYKASELISCGQAKSVDDDDESEREDGLHGGVRIEEPTHGDPGVTNADPQPGRRGRRAPATE